MKKLLIVLCILCMGFIFYNSSNTGAVSHEQSFALVAFFRSEKAKITDAKVQQNMGKKSLQAVKRDQTLDLIVRKNAHALEYFLLALFVSSALFAYGHKGKDAVVYILFICLLYAVLDEFHQKFVPLRTSSVVDVLIDFAGSIIGMTLFYIVYYTKKYFVINHIKQ